MKLKTLKTIESALNDAIMAEETKIRNWRAQIEIELRDALRNPEIGRGKEIPILPYSSGMLDVGTALRIIEKTANTTENDEVKEECNRLFTLFNDNSHEGHKADNRIAELRAALKDFSSISWRE